MAAGTQALLSVQVVLQLVQKATAHIRRAAAVVRHRLLTMLYQVLVVLVVLLDRAQTVQVPHRLLPVPVVGLTAILAVLGARRKMAPRQLALLAVLGLRWMERTVLAAAAVVHRTLVYRLVTRLRPASVGTMVVAVAQHGAGAIR